VPAHVRVPFKDVHGNPVFTRWDWLAEAEAFGTLAAMHPNVQFFNATDGGIAIRGVQSVPLSSISLKKKVPRVHTSQFKPLHVNRKRLQGAMHSLRHSLREFVRFGRSDAQFYADFVRPLEQAYEKSTQRETFSLRNYPERFSKEEREKKWDDFNQVKREYLKRSAVRHLKYIHKALSQDMEQRAEVRVPGDDVVEKRRKRVCIFYPNGQIKREVHYEKGVRSGLERGWSENGVLLYLFRYERGIPKGRQRMWHANGVLQREVDYDDRGNIDFQARFDIDGHLTEYLESSFDEEPLFLESQKRKNIQKDLLQHLDKI